MKKHCINDGVEFEAARATARFCSSKCRVEFSRKNERSVKVGDKVYVANGVDPVKKVDLQKKNTVEDKAQVGLMSKTERIERLNSRLAARGAPLLELHPQPTQFISTGIEALDALTGEADEKKIGGFPRKHITEIFGPKGSGKTSLMRLLAKNTSELNVLYVDAENGLIDPPENIIVSYSTTIEAVEELVFEAVRQGDYDLIIVDSVAVLTSEKELEDAKAGMGGKAKGMAQFVRRVNAALRPLGPDGYPDRSPGTAVVFINQLRDTMNGFGAMEYTPGGRSIEYAASLRLELRTAKADMVADKDSKRNIGQNVRVRVEKSRFGPRDQTTKFKIMYGDLV